MVENNNEARTENNGSSSMGFQEILAKDIMIENPVSIGIEEPFSKVVDILQEYGIRHLPVVDYNNRLKGIITQRDLYRLASPRKGEDGRLIYDKNVLDSFILKYVMTKDILSLGPEDTLEHVAELMIDKKCGCIPIVDEHQCLLGILTQIDIIKLLAKDFHLGPEGEIEEGEESATSADIVKIREKLADPMTTIEMLSLGKDVPRDFMEKAVADLNEAVKMLNAFSGGR
jgi:CBS domain-containing protein